MNINKKLGKVKDGLPFFFAFFIVSLIAFRLFYTTSYYDESFNLWVSFYTILGKEHLVGNPYIFQTGDLWNMPFVFLLYKITGELTGVVLLIRLCYLGLNLILTLIFYLLTRDKLGKRTSLLYSLLFPSFTFACIYSISYDSMFLWFITMGTLFLVISYDHFVKKKSFTVTVFFSGISFACMSYSYPTMVLIIPIIVVGIIILLRRTGFKQVFRFLVPFLIGGLIVFLIFITYILWVGYDNTIFANGLFGALTSGDRALSVLDDVPASSTEVLEQSSPFSLFFTFIENLLTAVFNGIIRALKFFRDTQKPLLKFSVVLIVQYFIGLFCKKKWIRVALLFEILFSSIWFRLPTEFYDYFDLIYSYAYYSLWFLPLYFYLDDENHKYWYKILLVLAYIPSIIGFCVVANTAYYQSKAPEGLYIGGLITIFVMYLVLKENSDNKSKFRIEELLIILFVIFNVLNFYNTSYEGVKWNQCDYRVQNGILKGINISSEDAYYETLEKKVNECKEELDNTIYCSMPYTGGYLWAKLDQGAIIISEDGEIDFERTADIAVLTRDEFEKVVSRLLDMESWKAVYRVEYQNDKCLILHKNIRI